MRVLFLSTWCPYPPDNGSKQRAYYLLRAMARAAEVTLITFSLQDAQTPTKTDHGAITVHAVTEDPFRYTRLPRALKYLSPVPLAYWPISAMDQAVRRAAAATRWDAVVALQMPVARYALRVNAATRILDVDTSLSYWAFESLGGQKGTLSHLHHWVSWQKGYNYERRWLSRFHLGTLVSSIEMSYLQRMVRANGVAIEVLPNGVDCDHNRPGLAQPQPGALVYNGSLTYSANYDAMQWFLAEIYPRIRAQQPEVTLTITGSTKGVDLVGLALGDSVQLTGFVEDVRIPVAQASVCVVPIRKGGGTRLKILEAMALGTPVVSTTKGAEGLDVTPGYDILIADEPAEFAEQITRLLRDAALREHLASNARRLMETRYDWHGIGQRFVHLVEEAVAKRDMTDERP